MPLTLPSAITEILAVGRRLDARGLAPATTGNYSIRLDDGRIAVTVSGRHKGRLGRDDVTQIDLAGHPLDARAPSAEAVLHAGVYRLYARAEAVLHVHSVASITLTRLLPPGSDVVLEGYETLKILPGVTTHDTRVVIPVFDRRAKGKMPAGGSWLGCELDAAEALRLGLVDQVVSSAHLDELMREARYGAGP